MPERCATYLESFHALKLVDSLWLSLWSGGLEGEECKESKTTQFVYSNETNNMLEKEKEIISLSNEKSLKRALGRC